MSRTPESFINNIAVSDPRVKVLPETWQYTVREQSMFTFETLKGDIRLNLNNQPHIMHFEVGLVTLPNEDAEVLLSYMTETDVEGRVLDMTEFTGIDNSPMTPWSSRNLDAVVAWRVNDSLMYLLSLADREYNVSE